MPIKTKNRYKRTSPQAGRSTHTGKKEHPAVRQRGEEPTAPAAVIADSVFALTVKPKSGVEVFCAHLDLGYTEDNAAQLFEDLWSCYRRAQFLLQGERLRVNPGRLMSLPSALTYVLSEFRKLLPAGMEFNVDYNPKQGYFFTVYKHCEFIYGWAFFPVRDVVQKLKAENRRLYLLFLSFLQALRKIGGVGHWEDGFVGSWLDDIDYHFDSIVGDLDDDDRIAHENDIQIYKTGAGAMFLRDFRAASELTPEQIIQRASRFDRSSPVVRLIIEGAELLRPRFSLTGYTYMSWIEEHEGDFFLPIDEQVTIMWSDEGYVFWEFSDYLDGLANEGLQEPVWFKSVKRDSEDFDLNEYEEASSWPVKISEFMARACELSKMYCDESAH